MKTKLMIQARCFPVTIRDERSGEVSEDQIIFDKEKLRAADALGLGNDEVIYRHYNRRGYRVLEIGKPARQTLEVDLEDLWKRSEGVSKD